MWKVLGLREELIQNWGLHLDLSCVWTLPLFSPRKGQGGENLRCRNMSVKWQDLTEVAGIR